MRRIGRSIERQYLDNVLGHLRNYVRGSVEHSG